MKTVLLACICVASVDAHGFVTKPKSRNSIVCDKLWPDYLKHYNNDNFWCKTDRESHCPPMPTHKEKDCQGSSTGQYPGDGVPKAPYCSAGDDSRISKAVKGLNSAGPVQANYTAGQTVEMEWQIAANHGGKYQYRICTDGSDTEECFKKNILKNDAGEIWFDVKQSEPVGTKFKENMKIPEGLNCEERCTLSFRWDGKAESVIFASCADIRIFNNGPHPGPHPGPAPPPPAPPPAPKPTSPTPPPAAKTCPGCGGGECGCSWVHKDSCDGKGDGSCCFKCCCGKDPSPEPEPSSRRRRRDFSRRRGGTMNSTGAGSP